LYHDIPHMNDLNYQRIAKAIDYIREHFKEQPNLDDIAESVHLSPFHFQKIFTEWAGVSPKKFLQYTSVGYAKQLLKDRQISLFDVADETGLSGAGRLHDLFIHIEGMTPGEYKNGGENLNIRYLFSESPFGEIIMASTDKGICYLAFVEDHNSALKTLQLHFPNAHYIEDTINSHILALDIFKQDWNQIHKIKLHLKGSPFQLKVWEALLSIPIGKLSSYGHIAGKIQHPKASRAVGTAIGSNPVAYLIPCHRVIQSSGHFGGYMWGPERKTAIIGWEMAKTDSKD